MSTRYTASLILTLGATLSLYAQSEQTTQTTQSAQTDSIASTKQLEEVKVAAYKKINKGDHRHQIFELDLQKLPSGVSADRALRYVPGVMEGSDGYSILGSHKGAKIQLDGHDVSMAELEALSSKDIWRVELIRGGVDGDRINVIRHRSLTHQFKGNVRLGVSLPERYSIGGNLIWQSPKANLSVMPNTTWFKRKGEGEMERKGPTLQEHWSQPFSHKTHQGSGILRFNYYPSKKWDNTVMVSYIGIGVSEDKASRLNGRLADQYHVDGGIYELQAQAASKYTFGKSFLRLRGGLILEGDGETLKSSAGEHKASNKYRSITADLTYQTELKIGQSEHQLSSKYALSHRRTKPDQIDLLQRNLIHELSVGDEMSLGKGWEGTLYMTLQHDDYRYASFMRRSWSLQPSASLSYTFGKSSVELSYDQSISRPTGRIIDPTRYYRSDTEYTEGNPDVDNELTHSLDLYYRTQLRASYLTAGLTYSYTQDVIGRVHALTDPNLQTWGNVGRSSYIGMSLGLNTSLLQQKMRMNLGAVLGYIDNKLNAQYESSSLSLGSRGLFYKGSANLSYTTSKRWSYSIYTQWFGRRLNFSSRQDFAPYVFFEVDKDIIPDRLSCSLSVLNPWGKMRSTTDYFFRGMEQSSWSRTDGSTHLSLSLTWHFGKKFRERQGNDTMIEHDRKSRN